jgi:hypothetical protein
MTNSSIAESFSVSADDLTRLLRLWAAAFLLFSKNALASTRAYIRSGKQKQG